MRWNEIINEDLSVVQLAKSYIMDILAPLQAQEVQSITVDQICDQLAQNPDLGGTKVSPDLVATALKGMDDIKVEPNPENGKLSVMLNNQEVDTKSAKEQEQGDAAVHSAAMRTVSQDNNSDDTGGL